jgi:hypothetical protein
MPCEIALVGNVMSLHNWSEHNFNDRFGKEMRLDWHSSQGGGGETKYMIMSNLIISRFCWGD